MVLIHVPVYCPVYQRADTRQLKYTFSHICRNFYHKSIPASLTAPSLRLQLTEMDRCARSQADAPLLILISGDCASMYTPANFDQPKQSVLYRPGMFPPCPATETGGSHDTDNGWIAIPYYATVACYSRRDADLVHTNSSVTRIHCRTVLVPPSLPVEDVLPFFHLFQKALQRANATSARITPTSYYSEHTLRPRSLATLRYRPY